MPVFSPRVSNLLGRRSPLRVKSSNESEESIKERGRRSRTPNPGKVGEAFEKNGEKNGERSGLSDRFRKMLPPLFVDPFYAAVSERITRRTPTPGNSPLSVTAPAILQTKLSDGKPISPASDPLAADGLPGRRRASAAADDAVLVTKGRSRMGRLNGGHAVMPYDDIHTDDDYGEGTRRMQNMSLCAEPSTIQAMKGCGTGLVGLVNLGNTCFMNAAIQCLSNSQSVVSYFLSDSYREHINNRNSTRGCVAKAFGDLIKKIWTAPKHSAITPKEFKSEVGRWAPRFMGYSQQDCQEFLRFVLDGLHEDLNRVTKAPPARPGEENEDDKYADAQKALRQWGRYAARNDSFIIDMFCGQLKSAIKCTNCGYVSTCFDPFLDLSVPIPKRFCENRYSSRDDTCTLDECLQTFTDDEVLQGDEAYHCSKCKSPQTAHKKLTIHKIPAILVLHIKRFSFSYSCRDKLSTSISFPIDGLNLSPYASAEYAGAKPAIYDLFAVSNHVGSLFGGHYFAHCRNQGTGDWFCYNDEKVSAIQDPSRICSSSAYLLFYQRRSQEH